MSYPYPIYQYSFYKIYYSNWHTGQQPIIFVLWSGLNGMSSNKIHAINLNAPQLGLVGRMKFIYVIKNMIKGNIQWNGRMMYRFLRRNIPEVVRVSYRTYWRHHIDRAAIINFGLNEESDIKMINQQLADKAMFESTSRTPIVAPLNMITKRGITGSDYRRIFADIKNKNNAGRTK